MPGGWPGGGGGAWALLELTDALSTAIYVFMENLFAENYNN